MSEDNKKVYIPNKGHHDYTDAKRFGSLSFVTKGSQNKFGVANMARCWDAAIENSSPHDYILVTSLSILSCVGAAAFAAKHDGRVNFLLWKKDRYIARTIVLNNKEGE